MLSLVKCGSVFQHKPNVKMYDITKQPYTSNCSSLPLQRRVVVGDEADYGSNNAELEFSEASLKKETMPKHVAIILDGSRRWLKAHGKPLSYEPFFRANTLFADLCLKWGIPMATSFIYSLNNLQRGQEANDLFFGQLECFLENNLEDFIRKGIKVSMVGERGKLSKKLQNMIQEVEEATRMKEEKQLELTLAICYAGTRDIVEAIRRISEKVKNGVIEPKAIDEALVDQELYTGGAPHPDLLIRTGGRIRMSDFMMWQMAQTELYFSHLCAPEFHELEFLQALRSFQQSNRTFGK